MSLAGATANSSASNDVAFPADATDTVSSMRWSPVNQHLAAASWDGKVRVYDVANAGSIRGVALITAEAPVFSCDFSKDGTLVAAAGADKKIHLLEASSGQTVSFAAHDAPVRAVRFVPALSSAAPVLASGSWDRTVRYWDARKTSQPLAALACGERVYSMDVGGPLLVVATADRQVHLVDLQANPGAVAQKRPSPLAHQIRVVAASPDGKRWTTGGIEGRASSNAVLEKDNRHDLTWRCHREQAKPTPSFGGKKQAQELKVWAVNDMAFHPVHTQALATVGSDGTIGFWDLDEHKRLKHFPDSVGGPITACGFSPDGRAFAYAVGYDWHKGCAFNSPAHPNFIKLKPVAEADVNVKK